MADYHDYTKLDIWQVSMDLCVLIYRESTSFPKSEIYGLTSQIRRAATSIPLNISEGSGRTTKPDFLHFLAIANGSVRELETLIHLSVRLGYLINGEELLTLCQRVGQMLTKLRQSLQK